MENLKPILSEEDSEKIYKAACSLIMEASRLLDRNPVFAVGALSLALTTAAGFCNMPYQSLIDLVSQHYENYLLNQLNNELKEKGETLLPKPNGEF